MMEKEFSLSPSSALGGLDNPLFTYKIESVDEEGNVHKLRLDFLDRVLEQPLEALIEGLFNLAAANPSAVDGQQILLRGLSEHLIGELQQGRLQQERLKEGVVLEFD